MEWLGFITVAVSAFLAAGLTMYSGFGLGTLMLPVFALFLPVEMAVVATAKNFSSVKRRLAAMTTAATERGDMDFTMTSSG